MPRKIIPLEIRFFQKVNKTDYCWNWTAAIHPDGYGLFPAPELNAGRAHRVSWILANGPIPQGLLCLHKCDNPQCVNPDHLYLGTNADNTRDKMNRNRHTALKGEMNGRAKLTEKDVLEIRSMDKTQKEIAKIFGIDQTTVSDIKLKIRWKHI